MKEEQHNEPVFTRDGVIMGLVAYIFVALIIYLALA